MGCRAPPVPGRASSATPPLLSAACGPSRGTALFTAFRRKHGYEPLGDEILAAIAARLEAVRTWEEITAPVHWARGEAP